jgi:hypothetical protein
MNNRKQWVVIGILGTVALIIRLFSLSSLRVEHYYSTGIYPYISIFLRRALGWLPISLGDILYGAAVVWLVIKIVRASISLFRKKPLLPRLLPLFRALLAGFFLIYVIFNILWGMNYNRRGIADQLGLPMKEYSLEELKELNGLLGQKVNETKTMLLQQKPLLMQSRQIGRESMDAYQSVNQQYAFLNYYPASIKASLWGWLGNYLGFMGYYNPFTGEGQVNTSIPVFLQPYTNCHEIAHQLGYAKENEANFVAYLAATSSTNPYFHYSAYLELFLYANRNLYFSDSAAARSYMKATLPAVREDLQEWRRFNTRHRNPVEPLIRWIYGKYLENNEQPSGMLTYDEVTGYLVAYYKKFGKI